MKAIVYGTDGGYLPLVCYSIKSISESTPVLPEIFVLLIDVTAEEVAEAKAFLNTICPEVRFVAVEEEEFQGGKVKQNITRAMYLRLHLHKFLGSNYERVLYIDGDTRIVSNINPLFDTDLKGKTLGAVHDLLVLGQPDFPKIRKNCEIPEGHSYFNSGVLLLDLARWKELRIGERALRFCLDYPQRCQHPDQCALNHVLIGDWLPLAPRWNYCPSLRDLFSARRVGAPQDPVSIYHFPGPKPWKEVPFLSSLPHHRWYCEVARNSPWPDFASPITLKQLCHLYSKEFLRTGRRETRRLTNSLVPQLLSERTRNALRGPNRFLEFLTSNDPFRLISHDVA